MTDPLNHGTVEQLLPAAALEILEGDELVRVTAHAQECDECARLLESYREVVAGLVTTLPREPLHPARSARLRARLLTRAGSHRSASAAAPPKARRFRGVVDRWAGWAVAATLAGVLLVHHSVHRPVAYGWLVAGALTFLVLALGVYVRLQRARLSSLEDRVATLMERETKSGAQPVAAEPGPETGGGKSR